MTQGALGNNNLRFYRPELDVLRFIAFFFVFLCHAGFRSSGLLSAFHNAGALGVCIFFMLSSYLITELLEREHAASNSINLQAFYLRRILRIWPLYFAMLGCDFILQHFLNAGLFTVPRLVAFLLLAGNWYVAAHGFINTISLPLWSVSVEEQFYLLWPSVRKYLGRPASVILSISVIPIAYIALAALCHGPLERAWFSSLVQFQFFGSGALLALILKGRTLRFCLGLRIVLFLLSISILVASQYLVGFQKEAMSQIFPRAAASYILANIGSVMILVSVLGEARLGAMRFLVYLGKISFGLYVFHLAALHAVVIIIPYLVRNKLPNFHLTAMFVFPTAFAITVLMASASYRYFESPILRYKRRFEVVRTRPV